MKPIRNSFLAAFLVSVPLALAQGTSFTYQGRLNDDSVPATGIYDFQFTLYGAATSGSPIGGTATAADLEVENGLFTVQLDFGAGAFEGPARWLQIAVRPGTSSGVYTTLKPRTPLLPAPYAIHAATTTTAVTATTAGGVPWGGISGLPAGFQDGVDNDTKYTAGTGLSLTGTAFSLDGTYTDGRFVNVAGDTMKGALSTPNLTVSETLTADQITSSEGSMSIKSGDIELQIDKDNSASLTAFFEIFNGAGKHVFYVSELGNSRTFGNHSVDGTVTADGFSGDGAGLTTAGLVKTTVLDVNCVPGVDYTTTFKKVADIGAFTKVRANSTIEVTFNGRLYVESMATAATGARFELRVDGVATTNGRARASVRRSEVGGHGVPTSITGIFTGLPAGAHTVSMWIQGVYGGGTKAVLEPGCWETDHVVIKELK